MSILNIFIFEFKHFARNNFKIVSVMLFVLASIYALQNGLNLYNNNSAEIEKINKSATEANNKVVEWFEKGKKGPDDRAWVNISQPFWAVWYASVNTVKKPMPLMPLSIGQAEQFGYYKQITNWSTVYDADLSEEIANPERLTTGTLDFGFAVLCLLPLLLIILLFSIGGLERDASFIKLIALQSNDIKKWLFARFLFYFILCILLLFALILPYSILTNAPFTSVVLYLLVCIGYLLFWFLILYFIALFAKNSSGQALKMVGLWLLFCVILPGTIHQISNWVYPSNFMTDYLDANRKETYAIFDLKLENIKERVLELHPELQNSALAKDIILNTDILNNSSAAVVNNLMKNAATKVALANQEKNNFIQNTYIINPFAFFQNKLNNICGTDYYSYQNYRVEIQKAIDQKIATQLKLEWNNMVVDKKKYQEILKTFNTQNEK